MVATRKGAAAVSAGDDLAGTRVIPLVVKESVVEAAEHAADVEKNRPAHARGAVAPQDGSHHRHGLEVAKGLIETLPLPWSRQSLRSTALKPPGTPRPVTTWMPW